jgi:hypothetical protein
MPRRKGKFKQDGQDLQDKILSVRAFSWLFAAYFLSLRPCRFAPLR